VDCGGQKLVLPLARESPAMIPLNLGTAEDRSYAAAQALIDAEFAAVAPELGADPTRGPCLGLAQFPAGPVAALRAAVRCGQASAVLSASTWWP
jgi:hypothetical protein